MTDVVAILDSYFRGTAPPSAWYVVVINYENFTAFDSVNDDMATHPGWEEFIDYEETVRPQWEPGIVTGDQPAFIDNPSGSVITPNADGQAIGFALCSESDKNGTTGQLVGPFFFEEGVRDLVASTPFSMNLSITMKRNTPTV